MIECKIEGARYREQEIYCKIKEVRYREHDRVQDTGSNWMDLPISL